MVKIVSEWTGPIHQCEEAKKRGEYMMFANWERYGTCADSVWIRQTGLSAETVKYCCWCGIKLPIDESSKNHGWTKNI